MKSKFVLSALCLLVSALIFSGCASFEQTAYRSLGTTTTLVDGAMNGWGDWVRAGQATAGDEAQVRAAYEHYQLAMAAARSTVLATTADSATESDLADSDEIGHRFRFYPDSVPEFAGQSLGAKRRSGSSP
ncbi:MAG: hypothetical protein ACYDC1_22000, partial [Limisphaerales bacterium]